MMGFHTYQRYFLQPGFLFDILEVVFASDSGTVMSGFWLKAHGMVEGSLFLARMAS